MKRILMVCLGNICRSPLAEGILKSKVNSNMILVDSAGTGGWHVGRPPDPRSIEVANNHNLNISNQRCRKFTISDFDNFDIIYAMDRSNFEDIISLSRGENDTVKVRLFRNELRKGQGLDVPDPYNGGEVGFEMVYKIIDEVCEVIVKKYPNELK